MQTAIKNKFCEWGLYKGYLVKKILIIGMVLWLLLAVMLPVIQLFIKAFMDNQGNFIGLNNFRKYFSTPLLFQSIYHTLFVALTTTFISLLLAFWYAYALNRTKIKWKSFFLYIAMIPLFAPTLMHGIALIHLFGNKGLFTTGFFGFFEKVFGFNLAINIHLYGPVGIIISEVIYTFPQVFIILSVSLAAVDYRVYEAAETLGAGRLRKFLTVTIPGMKYGLISASVVAFILSFTDFGAPKVVGGQYSVLATDIYKQVLGQQNFTMGATVGIILLIPAIAAFIADRIIQKKQNGVIGSKSVPYQLKNELWRDRIFFIYCSIIAALIFLWIGAVILAALVKNWPYNLSLTFNHFKFDDSADLGLGCYWNSIKVSFWSAILGTVITFSSAYVIEKFRLLKSARQIGYFLAIIPLALPGLVIGLSYVFFFNRPNLEIPFFGFNIINPLYYIYGTLFILVLANITHFYSVPFLTATTALKKLDEEFEYISESMDVPLLKTIFKVTIPLSLSAILEITMYYFVNSMTTVSAVIFLYTSKIKLASIAIINMDDSGNVSSAAAMSLLLVLTNIIVRIIYEVATLKIKKYASAWQKN